MQLLLLLTTLIAWTNISGSAIVPNVPRPPIRVLQGKSAPLTQAHLLIRRQEIDSLCRVEVDSSDPLTQTVGQVKPKVFNCFAKEGSVFYEHEGSPLRSHDWIRLLVYSFQPGNRSEAVPIRLAVTVQLRAKRSQGAVGKPQSSVATEYIVIPGPRPLTVPRFRGTSAPIDSNALNFAYDPHTTRCTVTYDEKNSARGSLAFRPWPMVGRLLDDQSSRVKNFRHDCHEFLLAGYRYEHRRPPSPDTDYIPVTVHLLRLNQTYSTEGGASAVTTENFYIAVSIDRAQKSPAPQLQLRQSSVSLAHTGGLPVTLPSDLLLIPTVLAASADSPGAASSDDPSGETETDDSGASINSGLIIQVTQIESVISFNINASFVDMREPTAGPIGSFKSNDLRDGRVAFQFASPTATDRVELRIRLRPIDAFFQEGPEVILQLSSVPNRSLQLFPRPMLAYTLATVRFSPANLPCSGSSCELVNYQIQREPYSGRMLMNNAPIESFDYRTLSNQADFVITYTHNGNIPSQDSIEMSVREPDSRTAPINFKFPIHVTRLWDSVSTLKSSNVGYRLGPGSQVCFGAELLDESVLRTLKHDCIELRYEVVKRPEYGRLTRAASPFLDLDRSSSLGSTFLSFSLSDLLHGNLVCYWQRQELESAQTNVWDSLTLKQAGRPDFTPLRVRIRLQQRPRAALINCSARYLTAPSLMETDSSFVLTRDFLRYETTGLSPNQIIYEVVLQPYYVGSNLSIDAGRLLDKRKLERIFTTGDNVRAKVRITSFKEVGCLSKFTQEDVDSGNVLYIPPLNDVGIVSRAVNVYLQPLDSLRNKASPHKLAFTVLPVDNQSPELDPQRLSVERGKRLIIKPEHLQPSDIDTEVDQLTLRLIKEPKHGRLYDQEVSIAAGLWFKVGRVRAGKISYLHDGSTSAADYFVLQATDGTQSSQEYNIYVNITERLAWDYGTKFYAKNTIYVQEGGQTVLTTEMFPKLKSETMDPRQISYLQGERPVKGEFELVDGSSRSVTQFNHEDLRSGRIVYRHTTGEIGPRPIVDICPMFVYSGSDWQTHRLTFSIQPVDNQPPTIADGAQVLVKEGGSTILSGNIIKVTDADTEAERLVLSVQEAPRHGEIRIINGSGDLISEFTKQQLLNGQVVFFQNKNYGTEYTRDNFTVIASDGTRKSRPVTVQVFIYPVTDELPSVVNLTDFSIRKGESRILNLSVADADVPEEEIVVQIRQLPKVGTLFQDWFTAKISKRVTEISNRQFTRRNLNYMRLVYRQDLDVTSLNDSFVIEASDPVYRVSKICRVAIATENEQPPIFTPPKTALRLFYGETVELTENHLLVRDPDTPMEAISISVVALPVNCDLLRAELVKTAIETRSRKRFVPLRLGDRFSQRDIQQGRISVRASRPDLGVVASATTAQIRLMATDGRFTTDAANLPLSLVPKPIEVLDLLLIRTSGLRANTRSITKITPEEVSVFYKDQVQSSASFQFSPQLESGARPCYSIDLEGSPLVNDSDPTLFLMSDILDRRVLFNATGCSEPISDLLIDVRSNWIGKSASGILPVQLVRLDVEPPVLTTVRSMSLRAHESSPISKNILNASDADTPAQELVYRIRVAPQKGVLILGKSPLRIDDTFTQAEVNNGTAIWYRSLLEPPLGLDGFEFTLEDTDKERGFHYESTLRRAPVSLLIQVAPSTRNPIELLRVKSPAELTSFGTGAGVGFRIRNDSLLAKPSTVLFELVSKPRQGTLKLNDAEVLIGGSFTQRDVDAGRVTYWFNQTLRTGAVGHMDNTSDAFEFIVRTQDRRFSYERTRFRFEWSMIFFRQTRYRVRCPRSGTLQVDVSRSGALDQTAFARFEFGGSARERTDFTVSSARTLSFNAGDRTAQISLYISERNSSSDLRLHIDLIAPGNALIGKNSRATVLLSPDTARDCASDGAHFTPSSSGDLALFRYYLRHYMARNRLQGDQAPSETEPDHQKQQQQKKELKSFNLKSELNSKSRQNNEKVQSIGSVNKDKWNRKQPAANQNRQDLHTGGLDFGIHVPSSEALRKIKSEEMQKSSRSDGFPRCTVYLSGEQRSNSRGIRYICNGGRWVTLESVETQQQQQQQRQKQPKQSSKQNQEKEQEIGATGYRKENDDTITHRPISCPTGWKAMSGASCVRLFKARLNYTSAVVECAKYSAALLELNGAAEMQWIRRNLKTKKRYWIGLSRHKDTGVWQQPSGADIAVALAAGLQWAPGHPRRRADCAFVHRNRWLKSRRCSQPSVRRRRQHRQEKLRQRRQRRQSRKDWESPYVCQLTVRYQLTSRAYRNLMRIS